MLIFKYFTSFVLYIVQLYLNPILKYERPMNVNEHTHICCQYSAQ
jgi:hypothetical protein